MFEGSKENIKKLHEDILNVLQTKREKTEENKSTFEPNSFWLGHIVQDILHLSWDDVPCRGAQTDYPEFSKFEKKININIINRNCMGALSEIIKAT